MTTIRVAKRPRYTSIARGALNDERLSYRARGVLAWLLDKPDDWRIDSEAIARDGKEGRDAIRTALRELESYGYLVRTKYRDKGRWATECVLHESPLTDAENPLRLTSDGILATDSQALILKTETEDGKEVHGTPVQDPPVPSSVSAVFGAWKASTHRSGKTVLDPKRNGLITKALALYPVADVIDAVRGWEHSAYHRGESERGTTVYNDLALLLRDATHIERFRDLARGPREPAYRPKQTLQQQRMSDAERLEQFNRG